MEAPLLSGLLAAELKKRMPNQLDMVFFTNSGAEGIETAIKYAKCATGRPAILLLPEGFSWVDHAALAVNGDEKFPRGFRPVFAGLPPAALQRSGIARTGTGQNGMSPLSWSSRSRARE